MNDSIHDGLFCGLDGIIHSNYVQNLLKVEALPCKFAVATRSNAKSVSSHQCTWIQYCSTGTNAFQPKVVNNRQITEWKILRGKKSRKNHTNTIGLIHTRTQTHTYSTILILARSIHWQITLKLTFYKDWCDISARAHVFFLSTLKSISI